MTALIRTSLSTIALTLGLLVWPSPVDAQQAEARDLLPGLDLASGVIAGEWAQGDDGLTVGAATGARVAILDEVPAEYDLLVEFTRVEGDDTVAVILPVGAVSPALELSAWQGQAHGLSRVDELPVKSEDNPTATAPGRIDNGERQRLVVSVRAGEQNATITATLNGEPLFDWEGEIARLQPNLLLNLPEAGVLGLAAQNSRVVFHRVAIRSEGLASERKPITPAPTPTPAPSPSVPAADGAVDLSALGTSGSPGWQAFNGAAFEAAEEDGRAVVRSRPGVGSGDRGAFIDGLDFSEGVIEINLKGSAQPQGSFLGVVFHGVDSETYDSVYFRPFNFGSADPTRRGHAVQYMSHPDFPWNQLRADRPEEFENPANPEPAPTDWFRVRVEVGAKRIRVFIDGASEPCLDVEKLGDQRSGRVGLWFNGVASFADLKVTVAK